MQHLAKRIIAIGLATAFAAIVTTSWAGLKVGSDFPNLSSFQFEGELPAALAGKIVMVDFWASWCGPCKKSFPALDELQKKFGGRGLVIVAVNEDQKKSDMNHFLKENKVSFTVVRDAAPDGKKLVDKVDVSTMPSTFIIDGAGKVRFIHSGFHGADTKKEFEQEIESLLKGMK
jgi:thiol-disulfide isomerase/thioredoxin